MVSFPRNFGLSKDTPVISVEQSIENVVTTTHETFKPKDQFEDLQDAIRKLKANDEKTSKQSSNEVMVDPYPSFAEMLHLKPK